MLTFHKDKRQGRILYTSGNYLLSKVLIHNKQTQVFNFLNISHFNTVVVFSIVHSGPPDLYNQSMSACIKCMKLSWEQTILIHIFEQFMHYAGVIAYRQAKDILGRGRHNLSKPHYISLIYINVIHSVIQAGK